MSLATKLTFEKSASDVDEALNEPDSLMGLLTACQGCLYPGRREATRER
jgi:hypothetical protein